MYLHYRHHKGNTLSNSQLVLQHSLRNQLIYLSHFPAWVYLHYLKNNDYIIEKDSDIIKKKINQADLKIYENYNKLPYEKFIITNKIDSSKYIFVIASRAKKKGLNVLNLFYISNNEEFKKNWDKFKFIILTSGK